MAKEIIHVSQNAEIIGEFDVELAAELAVNANDNIRYHGKVLEEMKQKVLRNTICAPFTDKINFHFQEPASLADPTGNYKMAMQPHVDRRGLTLLGYTSLPTRIFVGEFPIPAEMVEMFYHPSTSRHGLPDSPGFVLFQREVGQEIIANALESGELLETSFEPGSLVLLDDSTIHAQQVAQTTGGSPRLKIIQFQFDENFESAKAS